VVVVNKSATSQTVFINVKNFGYGEKFFFHTLTGGNDNVPFSLKVFVNDIGPELPSGGPEDVEAIEPRASAIGGGVKLQVQPGAVQYVLVEAGDHVITTTEVEGEKTVQVFPNPASGNIHVTMSTAGFSKIRIVDMTGRHRYERSISVSETSFDVKTDLPPGLYSLLLYKGWKIHETKIIIY
jgi:hypothetical protein